MKKALFLTIVVATGVGLWLIGSRLSADAVGMLIGVVLGMLAGIPAALLVLAGRRRQEEAYAEEDNLRRSPAHGGAAYGPCAQQPPVIVLAAPSAPVSGPATVDSYAYPVRGALPGPATPAAPVNGRRFKVVGEKEEWLDEW